MLIISWNTELHRYKCDYVDIKSQGALASDDYSHFDYSIILKVLKRFEFVLVL